MHITVSRDVPYLSGGADPRTLDVYRPSLPGPRPTVLLWHGSGRDEKHVMAPLADAAAALGVTVVVPDWRPDASDRGRGDLLGSLRYVREHAALLETSGLVLAGWSAGAGAAVALALTSEVPDGGHPSAVVGIAGRYDVPSRSTGTPPLTSIGNAPDRPAVPIGLVHGSADTLIPVGHATEFLAALHRAGHPARLDTLDTDHAGVVMTEYDPAAGFCVPAVSPRVQDAGHRTARILAQAAAAAAPGAPATTP
ncbi:alpha/beta hydrolase [Streptomyces sp. NPDC048664]|uniref:alpha/beta hydrolase family protein n=1 Tax=Streptomyces sp. NPDC048664 TaxID=3154505 RepID=UPI0034462551